MGKAGEKYKADGGNKKQNGKVFGNKKAKRENLVSSDESLGGHQAFPFCFIIFKEVSHG